jgi:hypothetical protein
MSDEPPFRRDALAPDTQSRLGRSLLDVASSLVTCLAFLVLMYVAVDSSFLLVLALTIPTAGPSYDEEREYGEAESATSGEESERHEGEEEREDEGPEASAEDEQGRGGTGRRGSGETAAASAALRAAGPRVVFGSQSGLGSRP